MHAVLWLHSRCWFARDDQHLSELLCLLLDERRGLCYKLHHASILRWT